VRGLRPGRFRADHQGRTQGTQASTATRPLHNSVHITQRSTNTRDSELQCSLGSAVRAEQQAPTVSRPQNYYNYNTNRYIYGVYQSLSANILRRAAPHVAVSPASISRVHKSTPCPSVCIVAQALHHDAQHDCVCCVPRGSVCCAVAGGGVPQVAPASSWRTPRAPCGVSAPVRRTFATLVRKHWQLAPQGWPTCGAEAGGGHIRRCGQVCGHAVNERVQHKQCQDDVPG